MKGHSPAIQSDGELSVLGKVVKEVSARVLRLTFIGEAG